MTEEDPYRFLPEHARIRIRELREGTGRDPAVERLPTGWSVSLESERVRLEMRWTRAHPRTHTKSAWSYGSSLFVDGQRRPPVTGMKEFLALWEEPTMDSHPGEKLKDAQFPELGSVPGPAPATVESLYQRGVRRLGEENVKLGYADGAWQVMSQVTAPDGDFVQAYVEFRSLGEGHPWEGTAGIIALNGKDYSRRAADLDLVALGLVEGAGELPPALRSSGRPRPSAPGGSNAVAVRKATVVRT